MQVKRKFILITWAFIAIALAVQLFVIKYKLNTAQDLISFERLELINEAVSSWLEADATVASAAAKNSIQDIQKALDSSKVAKYLSKLKVPSLDILIFDQNRRLLFGQADTFQLESITDKIISQNAYRSQFEISNGLSVAKVSSVYSGQLKLFIVVFENSNFVSSIYNLLILNSLVISLLVLAFIIVISASWINYSLRHINQLEDSLLELSQQTKNSPAPISDKASAQKKQVLAKNFDIETLAEFAKQGADKLKFWKKQALDYDRLHKEIELAQFIQSTFAPNTNFKLTGIDIGVLHGSASECTGDWWYYKEVEDYVFMVLGDATGHGMPAALVTSTVLAAATTIQWNSHIEPSDVLSVLNSAVYRAAGSKILMTALCLKINRKESTVTYSNASHETPFIFDGQNVDILSSSHLGPRLGDGPDAKYNNDTQKLVVGGYILIHTDGLFEVNDKAGRPFSERKYIKTIKELYRPNQSAKQLVEDLKNHLLKISEVKTLPDDITLLFCKVG